MPKFLKRLSVDQFNMLYPVGSKFDFYSRKTDATPRQVITRSEAWALGHGAVVVSVSGISGGVAITHLIPVQE